MRTRNIFSTLLCSLLSFTLAACGGVSKEDSTKVMTAALTASKTAEVQVTTATTAAFASGTGMGTAGGITATVMGDGASVKISGTVTNPAGGTATLDGTVTIEGGGNSSSVMKTTYKDWKDAAQNLTLNGTLNASAKVTGNGASTEVKYTGDLQVSGLGSIKFDLTVKTAGTCVNQSGTVGGNTIEVKVGAGC